MIIETEPTTPALPRVPTSASPAAQTVWVHVRSPDVVDLSYRAERRDKPVFLCTSPCDIAVPKDGTYRIQPTGSVRASKDFWFIGAAPKQTVTVHPASRWGFIGGIVLTSAGMASLGLGAVGLMANAISDAAGYGPRDYSVSAVLAIAGAAVAIAGVIIIMQHARTGVTVTPDPPTPDEPPQSLASTSSWRVESGPPPASGPHLETGPRFEAGRSSAVFPLLRIAF